MSLIANGKIENTTVVIADKLFPPLSVKRVRDFLRTDSSVTDTRLMQLIGEELLDVQHILLSRLDKFTLSEAQEVWYFSAVANGVGAKVCEIYRNYDSTNKGDARARDMSATIDEYRRNKQWALSKLIGRNQTVAELI
ncbi:MULTISPECIES: head completion/stabilization protein [Moraxella]|uniref:Phage head completion-stabilization protein n=1 Tax=Moraxella catarrhalis TaxID=480 RepID=A0A7Z1A3I5_MORCA|nr:head completion/stabilization protein [Moraxella catarrhalis]OAV00212.1 Phage head completion-stabilization protein [Moraxella catarrhalis]STY82480.1 Phage head completion protein (GPL) [Moraxella catarrhalis]